MTARSFVAYEVDAIDFISFNAPTRAAHACGRLCSSQGFVMGVHWAAGLIRWKPHIASDGTTYSLAHLHPFRFTCELGSSRSYPARTITINVGFSLHVFTCALAEGVPHAEEYRDSRERRAFDHE